MILEDSNVRRSSPWLPEWSPACWTLMSGNRSTNDDEGDFFLFFFFLQLFPQGQWDEGTRLRNSCLPPLNN